MKPPSERDETETAVAAAVFAEWETAMTQFCDRLNVVATRNNWPRDLVDDAVTHYGGWAASDYWETDNE